MTEESGVVFWSLGNGNSDGHASLTVPSLSFASSLASLFIRGQRIDASCPHWVIIQSDIPVWWKDGDG